MAILSLWSLGTFLVWSASLKSETAILTLFSIFYLMPLLNLPLVPFDTRILAACLLVLALLTSRRGSKRTPSLASSQSFASAMRSATIALSALGCFFLVSVVSLFWSVSVGSTLEAVLGIGLLIAGTLIFATSDTANESITATVRVLLLVCAVSVALIVIEPSMAFEGGRFRGVVENANGLGTIAAFGAILSAGWSRRWMLAVPFFLAIVVASGSRGAMLAAIVGLLVLLLAHKNPRYSTGVRFAFTIYVGVLLYVAWFITKPDLVVLRTNDSRSDIWLGLVPYLAAYWPLGSGAGTLESFSTNSFLKVAAEVGLAGLVCSIIYVLALFRVALFNYRVLGIWAAGLVASLVESWLLTGGSYYSFLFLSVFGFVATVRLSSNSEPGRVQVGVK